jgi:hypothetical protein
VNVSKRKPELCYRIIPETSLHKNEEDTVEKLRKQELLYFIMLAFLRRENYETFGIKNGQAGSDE